MPAIDRQSARLGVSFSVISVSSSASASRTRAPGGHRRIERADRRHRRDAAAPWPSTAFRAIRRRASRLIAGPPGSIAPSNAHGAGVPTASFGAPHTICSFSGNPASTVQTRRRSAPGCGSTLSMRATTTSAKGGAAGAVSSTSRPAIVSLSQARCSSAADCTACAASVRRISSSCAVMRIVEEAQIVLVEQPQVIHAIPQHREPVGPTPKAKPWYCSGSMSTARSTFGWTCPARRSPASRRRRTPCRFPPTAR